MKRTAFKTSTLKRNKCKYLKLILGCLLSIHSKKLLCSDMLTSLNSTLSWDKLCNHWCLWPNHLVTDIYSWFPIFVMILVISTEHRALNHIPFIYLIFLDCNNLQLGQKYLYLDCFEPETPDSFKIILSIKLLLLLWNVLCVFFINFSIKFWPEVENMIQKP